MKKLILTAFFTTTTLLNAQSAESVESFILNANFKNMKSFAANTNQSSLKYSAPSKVYVKDNITYKDHVFEASSFSVPLITDYFHMDELIAQHKLVNVPEEGEGYIIQKLTHSRAVLIEPALVVLEEISTRFYAENNRKLSISSLTRTQETQSRLRRVNSNAAKGNSSHEYGAAFDISYSQYDNIRGRNYTLESKLQAILDDLVAQGKIYYIKERRQPCFHVTVRNPHLVYPEMLEEDHYHEV
ncbi:DUF5715 family protein [Weeksella virosa]|uniref:DUF5715 family protein n=1 Tax=Weeksella virosa TaxID=1014 RepID=UPI000DFCD2AC|nr:DUF5715 family protein [Weeksella virosa]MDK7675356.1 DUF5715 family protein [Weeksella virosa]SUP54807.1 Uncharacterised protein [Weeksella virosa]